jgi:hypothetical protein
LRAWRITPLALLVTLGAASAVRAQDGFTFNTMPASIQEIDIGLPDRGDFSEQVDVQFITQGADWDVNRNPYAYPQRLHIRPWLQYHRTRGVVWAFSPSYIKHYAIPAVDQPEQNELRLTAMGTSTQKRSWGSLYEQGRFEVRNIKEENKPWEHIPRVRVRFGQAFNIHEASHNGRIAAYEEVIVKHEDDTTGLDSFRLFGAYAFNPAPKWTVKIGVRSEWQRKPGRVFDVLVGPSMTAHYQWGRRIRPTPIDVADPDE